MGGEEEREREKTKERKSGEGDLEEEDSLLSPVSNLTKCNCSLFATLSYDPRE